MSTATAELLVVSGMDASVSATDTAREVRDQLLAKARAGSVVKDAAGAGRAGELLKEIKAFTRQIEDARKEVKEPVLDLTRRIDGLAKELVGELEAEANRISRLVGAYQAEQNRLAEEARRKAWEEEQRIKEEANRRIAEAQQTAKTEADFERKAEKIEAKAVQQIVETRVAAAAAAPAKPAGLATRTEILFEVEDVQTLYKFSPSLVVLTPNAAAIKAILKTGAKLPGVRSWTESKTFVR